MGSQSEYLLISATPQIFIKRLQHPQSIHLKMSKICVVLGSVREGRLGERVANLILQQLKEVGAVPTLLDPKVVDAPLLQQPLHFMKDPSAAPAWMQETHALLKDTEGFVIVTPEYNCSLPP